MTKIQEVALALIKADGAEDPNMSDAVYDDYELRARYAIEAMMQPTVKMVEWGTTELTKTGGDNDIPHIFNSMLMCALEEK